MANVRDLLNQVWLGFRKAGIADDLIIIDHIAALLLQIASRDRRMTIYGLGCRSIPTSISMNFSKYSQIQQIRPTASRRCSTDMCCFGFPGCLLAVDTLHQGTSWTACFSSLRVAPTHRLADCLWQRRFSGSSDGQ
jgi:hypothetical protein